MFDGPLQESPAPKAMFVEFERVGEVLHARLVCPKITDREAPIVTNDVTTALTGAAGVRYLVLDCTKVDFIATSGIGTFVQIRGAATAAKATTVLHAVRSDLAKMLKMARMDKLFKMTESEKDLAKATGK